jgi:hypothetical protein
MNVWTVIVASSYPLTSLSSLNPIKKFSPSGSLHTQLDTDRKGPHGAASADTCCRAGRHDALLRGYFGGVTCRADPVYRQHVVPAFSLAAAPGGLKTKHTLLQWYVLKTVAC